MNATYNPAKPAITKIVEPAQPPTVTLTVTPEAAGCLMALVGSTNDCYMPEVKGLYSALRRLHKAGQIPERRLIVAAYAGQQDKPLLSHTSSDSDFTGPCPSAKWQLVLMLSVQQHD